MNENSFPHTGLAHDNDRNSRHDSEKYDCHFDDIVLGEYNVGEYLFDASAYYIFIVLIFDAQVHHDFEELFFCVLVEVDHALHFLFHDFPDF